MWLAKRAVNRCCSLSSITLFSIFSFTYDKRPRKKSMESEHTSGGFSISSLLGLDGKQAERSTTDKKLSGNKDMAYGPDEKPHKRSEKERPSRAWRCAVEEGEKRYRATFDKSQIYQMERVFLLNHYPDVAARLEMSNRTGLSEAQVQIWFQNRRAKWRKQQRKRRHDAPMIFGLGYPSHLARFCGGLDPFSYFPYEYYNTDFWTCARQQVAALQFASPQPTVTPLVPSPGEGTNLEIKNDSSLLSLRLKAKEHLAAMGQVILDY